jgi:PDZ domain-containing protein
MSRRLAVVAALIAATAAVALLVGNRAGERSPPDVGFLGLEFAPLTRAAQARAPYLTDGGALIVKVVPKSPAAEARFAPGEVVTAIDLMPVSSAPEAAEMLKTKKPHARISLTYLDLARGDGRPHVATAELADAPPLNTKVYSVEPPRTLAREWDFEPSMAAGASWSKRIARGAVRPLALTVFSRGRCSALAPEDWTVLEAAPDGTSFELVSSVQRARAIFATVNISSRASIQNAVEGVVARFARVTPQAGPALMADSDYRVIDFGSSNGYAGFALYHAHPQGMTGLVISMWIVAVPASNVAGLAPLAGAVALSIRCNAPFAEHHRPYDESIAATSVSERCLRNDCDETDFAGAYNAEMHTGYVHAANADNFLIDPRRDIWATGPNGPGTYRQVGGTLEKLEPGRTN